MNRLKLTRVLDFLDKFVERVGKIDSVLIIFMLIITALVVVGRSVRGVELWLEQTGEIGAGTGEEPGATGDPIGVYTAMHAVYVVLGAAYILNTGGHITLDVLSRRFSPKVKAIVDSLVYPLLIFTVFVMMWMVAARVPEELESWMSWRELFSAGVMKRFWSGDTWLIAVWPIGMALLLISSLARWARSLLAVVPGGSR